MDDKTAIINGMARLVSNALTTESNVMLGNIRLTQSMIESRLKAVKHSLDHLPAILNAGSQPMGWELKHAPGSVLPFLRRTYEEASHYNHDLYAQVSVFSNGFITVDLCAGMSDHNRLNPSLIERYDVLQQLEDEVIQWAIYFNWRNIAVSVPFKTGRRWLVFGPDADVVLPEEAMADPVGLSNVPMFRVTDEELHIAYVASPDFTPTPFGDLHRD